MALSVGEVQATLTLKDQLSAQAQDAVAKFKAAIGQTTDAVKPLDSALDQLTTRITEAFSIYKLAQFSLAALDASHTIELTAERMGIADDAAQRLGFAARESGLDIDSVATAVQMLAKRLETDDKNAIGAMNRLGLSTQQFLQLDANAQITLISQALGEVGNQTAKSADEMELFGRMGGRLDPLLKNLEALKGQADATGNVMSSQTVKAAAELDREWIALKGSGEVLLTEVLVPMKPLFELIGGALWAVGQAIKQIPGVDIINLANAEKDAADQIKNMAEKAQQQGEAIAGATQKHAEWIARVRDGVSLAPSYEAAMSNMKEMDKADAEQKKIQEEATRRATAAMDALVGSAPKVDDLVAAFGRLTPTQQANVKVMEEMHKALQTWKDRGNELTPVMQAVYDKTNVLIEKIKTFNMIAADMLPPSVNADFVEFGGVIDGVIVTTDDFSRELNAAQVHVDMLGNALPAMKIGLSGVTKTFEEATVATKDFGDYLQADLPKAILGAVEKGGNIGATIGTAIGADVFKAGGAAQKLIQQGATSVFGGAIGGALGSIVPGLGALIGPALSALTGLFSKSEESAKVSPLRDIFFQMQGGLESLNPRILQVTGSLNEVNAVFKAKTVKDYDAAINELTATLALAKQQVDAVNTSFTATSAKITDVTALTPGLQAAIDTALNAKTPDEFQAALSNINGVIDTQTSKTKVLSDTLSKYGLAWGDTGKAAQQANLDQVAQGLIADFITLKNGGVDVNKEITAMAPNLNAYVNDSRKAGTEIPEAMRSVIQSAIDAGQLYDSNGVKITDMKNLGVTFGTTMQDTMKGVQDSMANLADVIKNVLAPAIANIPQPQVVGHVSWNVDKIPPPDFQAPPPDTGANVVPEASGGMGRTTGPAWFYSGGNEDFAFSGEGKSFGGSSPAPSSDRTHALLQELSAKLDLLPSALVRVTRDTNLILGRT